MSSRTATFFRSQDEHPWSRIKNQVLGSYMTPYIAKVMSRVRQPLLLIDAFAGPGRDEDGNPGSPLIICQAAELKAKGNYRAIFFNNRREYHEQLEQVLTAAGWTPAAQAILGDSQDLLRMLVPLLTTQSVFLYVDPFGLDCEFDLLEPFLDRNKAYSTEILINLQAPILHRLAAREAYHFQTGDPNDIAQKHDKLTRTLGGDYWKDALLSTENIDTKTREQLVVAGYRRRLSSTGYLTYTGACPIQEGRDSRTKYYMIFASRHPDAMVLFNDAMCKAFNQYMNENEVAGTLFADQPWTAWRDTATLVELVVEYVSRFPDKKRKHLWPLIINDYFMLFTESEYKRAVTQAAETGRIMSPTERPTKRLNDDCVLMPAK